MVVSGGVGVFGGVNVRCVGVVVSVVVGVKNRTSACTRTHTSTRTRTHTRGSSRWRCHHGVHVRNLQNWLVALLEINFFGFALRDVRIIRPQTYYDDGRPTCISTSYQQRQGSTN